MVIAEKFSVLSPNGFQEKLGTSEVPLGWFVISSRYFPDPNDRRRAHGNWFRIGSEHGAAYRVLRFSPNLKGSEGGTGDIVIDWGAWLDLNGRAVDVLPTLDLKIAPVPLWQTPWMAVRHPDPGLRASGWLAILSVALGILALIISILPLLLT